MHFGELCPAVATGHGQSVEAGFVAMLDSVEAERRFGAFEALAATEDGRKQVAVA